MHNIIVCDDNVACKNALVMALNKYASLYDANVFGFSDGREMMEFCSHNNFDIIYMDIELGEDNGINFAKILKQINPQALIIYISAYDCYFKEMVQAEPFRFLPKAAADAELWEKKVLNTLDLAMKRINGEDTFSYEFSKKQYTIELPKVLFFYSVARKIYIAGNIGDLPNSFYGKIDDLEEKLKKVNNNFIRINKSYIVNAKYSWNVLTKKNKISVGGNILSVTPKYRAEVEKKITGYLLS